MSVYKSERTESKVRFLYVARELKKETIRITRKFPKSYYKGTVLPLLDLANEVFISCFKANKIFLGVNIDEHDYDLRHRYFRIAQSNLSAFIAELTLCYEFVKEGENFLGRKNKDGKVPSIEKDRVFKNWVSIANELEKLLAAVVKSDRERMKKYLESDKRKATESLKGYGIQISKDRKRDKAMNLLFKHIVDWAKEEKEFLQETDPDTLNVKYDDSDIGIQVNK